MSYFAYKRCDHKKKPLIMGGSYCFTICEHELPCGHKCDLICHQNYPKHSSNVCLKILCEKKCPKELHTCDTEHSCQGPCPPCTKIIETYLTCGHVLETPCEAYDELLKSKDPFKCRMPCLRYRGCGHDCFKECGEECGLCETIVTLRYKVCLHTYEAPCHTSMVRVPCKSPVLVNKQPKCGHKRYEPCCEAYRINNGEEDSFTCQVKCTKVSGSGCGHECSGNCSECFQGRLHKRCERPCSRKHVYCAHWCMSTCSKNCPPCKQRCESFCEHSRCQHLCCNPCDPCMEKCPAGCQHSKCSKLCSEPCDREPCSFPCPKKLKCDHMCIGFCGELCPPLCRICDKKELEDGLMLEDEVNEDSRFIYLKYCGHTIEIASMNQWMWNLNTGAEIQIASCPVCRNPIYNLKRYSHAMAANFKEIRAIKARQVGETEQNLMGINELVTKIFQIENPLEEVAFYRFQQFLLNQITAMRNYTYKDEVSFLRMAATTLENAVHVITEFTNLSLNQVMLMDLKKLHYKLFTMIESRSMPFQPLEVKSVNREIARINCAAKLFKRVTVERNIRLLLNAVGHYPPRDLFIEAYKMILSGTYFNDEDENFIISAITDIDQRLHYDMGIDENERHEIISSFKSFVGRWCKCPNGHIYVITECGGAMEIGTCNECGEPIGGEEHSLLQQNTFAPEMIIPIEKKEPVDN